MSAAWLLNGRHDVTVYEKEPRLGGHSNTVDVPGPNGPVPVDTGFIVYNTRTYPNLTALFDHLGVPTKASDMSFAASLRRGQLEYAGTDLNGLFGQRRNLFRPRFWTMIADLLRFYKTAPAFAALEEAGRMSLGDYLTREKYGRAFIEDHLLPMGAAIWSTTPTDMLNYPAKAFIRFFESHGLLLLRDRPQWRTVEGGSRAYVNRLTADYAHKVRHGGVRAVRRASNGVTIEDNAGHCDQFDHVVIAAHADEALALLADADPHEQSLLGKWRYTRNRAVLHTDQRLMPNRKRTWASWNFIEGTDAAENSLCVTYWMNLLQGLPASQDIFVSLNPVVSPARDKVLYEVDYTHPYFDAGALASQDNLWTLQGRRHTWFCGSYFGHGFHEDGLQSGLAVAEQLGGVRRPWNVAEENGRIRVLATQNLEAAA